MSACSKRTHTSWYVVKAFRSESVIPSQISAALHFFVFFFLRGFFCWESVSFAMVSVSSAGAAWTICFAKSKSDCGWPVSLVFATVGESSSSERFCREDNGELGRMSEVSGDEGTWSTDIWTWGKAVGKIFLLLKRLFLVQQKCQTELSTWYRVRAKARHHFILEFLSSRYSSGCRIPCSPLIMLGKWAS